MSGRDSTQSLLVLRKLTRAITDVVRQQVAEHLATLTPLLKPAAVLGDYVLGYEWNEDLDEAFFDWINDEFGDFSSYDDMGDYPDSCGDAVYG